MANQWQYIPDTVIDDVDRRKKADEWAASERQRLADEWAAQQQTMLSEFTPSLEEYNAGRGFTPGASDIQGPGDAGIYPPMKEMLRRGVEDQQGALPRVMNRISGLAEPAAEFVARGGERLGAAVRGEDWQSMPSGYDANNSLEQNIVDLRAGYKQRPEHFPGEKFITQVAADPTNVVPSGLLGKAGMTVVREGKPIAEAAGALSKYVPGMGVDDISKTAQEVVPSNVNVETSNIEQITGEVVPPGGAQPPSGGNLPPGGDVPLLTGPAGKVFEPPANRKSLGWDIAWDRIRNVAARQGPAGKQLANNLHGWREQYQTQTGDWVSRMPNVKALSDKDYANFVDSIEGSAKPANEAVFKSVVDWAKIAVEVEDKAVAAGIKMGHLPNYFPRMYEPKVLEKHFDQMDTTQWNNILDRMMQTGQADSREEANSILRMVADQVHTRKAGNLEMSRVANFPDYRRDKAVLGEYLSDAAKRIAFANTFGPKAEKADALLQQIASQGYDKHGELNRLFGVATGGVQYGFREHNVSNVIRAANVLTKMGLGAITNASQPVNTTIVGGLKTLKLLPEAAMSKEAHDFAIRIGTITDDALNDLAQGTGYAGKTMKYGAPGFNPVERFNRTFASLAGREMAEDFAKRIVKASEKGKQDKWAMQGIKDLGLDPDIIINRAKYIKESKSLVPRNTTTDIVPTVNRLKMPTQQTGLMPSRSGLLTQQEIDQAARNVVERTQFLVDPQDLPAWASSPLGRVITQFKTYGYNQTAFMWREVIEKALPGRLGGNRDVGPLIRFLIFGTVVGMGTATTKDLIKGNNTMGESPKDWILRGMQQAGGLGIVGDVLTGLNPPGGSDYQSGERYAIQATSTLLGPSAGTFMEGASTVPSALQGKPERLERFALKQVPVVGSPTANRVLPYGPKKSKAPNRYPGRYTPPKSNAQKTPAYPGRR